MQLCLSQASDHPPSPLPPYVFLTCPLFDPVALSPPGHALPGLSIVLKCPTVQVYLGKWRDATDVAVKCLSPALLTTDGDLSSISPTHVKELLDEARLLFSLRHPNVVWVYGIVLDQPGDESDNRFRCPAIIAGD